MKCLRDINFNNETSVTFTENGLKVFKYFKYRLQIGVYWSIIDCQNNIIVRVFNNVSLRFFIYAI